MGIENRENTMIYRYMTFEQFANMLETETMYLNRVDNWPDKHELREIREAYIFQHKWHNEVDKEFKLSLMRLGLANVYAQCWNRSSIESNAMWQLYSKGLGVRIGCSIEDVSRFINGRGCCNSPEWELVHFPIEYSADCKLKTENSIIGADVYLEALKHKIIAYAYEEEYRFVLFNRDGLDSIGEVLKDRQTENNAYRSLCNREVIKYAIDLSRIKEIIIDYMAPSYHRETIKRMCYIKQMGNKIIESQLL